MIETDEQLVQRARRGDRDAFAGLVARYEKPALLLVGSILRNWHDARDVVQDSFVVAYERLNKLWSPHKFSAWFLQIARRNALVHVRRRRSRIEQTVSIGNRDEPAGDADSDMTISMDLAVILDRLPKQECVVVTLRHLNELSVAEIAAITGRPVGTVTKQLSRAYARMRPWLDEWK